MNNLVTKFKQHQEDDRKLPPVNGSKDKQQSPNNKLTRQNSPNVFSSMSKKFAEKFLAMAKMKAENEKNYKEIDDTEGKYSNMTQKFAEKFL